MMPRMWRALAHRLLAAAPLTDRERMVVEARFFADPEETLQEIGDRLGICKERVRQIEAVALRKLRDAAKKIAR
jgi:RNA polymerase sigma factor (sigma-70 family)